jgi:hypothetical protein
MHEAAGNVARTTAARIRKRAQEAGKR